MSKIYQALEAIPALDNVLMNQAQKRLDALTKPRGSLGRLEDFARLYVSMRGDVQACIRKKVIVVFAADHGVVEEGVSAYPKDVTYQMVLNFLRGGAAINVIAKHVKADVTVVDIGVDHDFEPLSGLMQRKVAYGTRNMAKGPAMDRNIALKAMEVGYDVAMGVIDHGADILG